MSESRGVALMEWLGPAFGALLALAQAFLFFVLHGIREQMKSDRDAFAVRLSQDKSEASIRIAAVELRVADAREHMLPRKEFQSELAKFFQRQDQRDDAAALQREEMLRRMAETTAEVRLVVQRAEYMEKQAEAMVEEVAEITNIANRMDANLRASSPFLRNAPP
jgi:hypothetical protein